MLDSIFIRYGTKLYRQVVGIPMGTSCAPLVADLFLFYYERDFMMSLSDDKQADVIDAFNTTSRYLDDILNINNVYFDNMVSQIQSTLVNSTMHNSILSLISTRWPGPGIFPYILLQFHNVYLDNG